MQGNSLGLGLRFVCFKVRSKEKHVGLDLPM